MCCGYDADAGLLFLILTTMTTKTAAAVIIASGRQFISGHRDFTVSGTGQRGHDGGTESCWYMKGYPAVPCRKATAGEQMV